MIATTTPAGTQVRTADGVTGTTVGAPALTSSGYVVTVQHDDAHAHLTSSGRATYRLENLEAAPAPAPAPVAPAEDDDTDQDALDHGICPNCGTELEESAADDNEDIAAGWTCPFCKAEWA